MAAAVAAVVVVVTGRSGPSPDATFRTSVRSEAADVVVTAGSGWVVDDDTGTVRRFDVSSGAWQGPPRNVAKRPVAIAAGYGELWVADAVGNQVVRVDTRTGEADGSPIAVGDEPVSVATGEDGVWVASLTAGSVSLIDPATDVVEASAVLPDGAVRVAVGDGAVWVTGTTDTLTRVSPHPDGTRLSYRVVDVGQEPIGVTTSPGAVWVADAESGTVDRVDPTTLRERTYHVGGDPVAVAVYDGRVWAGDGQTAALTALNPETGTEEGKPVHLPGVFRRLVLTGGSLLAATANPGEVVNITPG